MMKLKLAFALFKYFPYGGLQRDFLRIANLCAARGHDVHVYTTAWHEDKEAIACTSQPSKFQLHLLTVNGWQNHTRYRQFARKFNQQMNQTQNYHAVIGFNKLPNLDLYYAADACYQATASQERSWLYRQLPRYQQYLAMEKAVFAQGLATEILLIAHQQLQEFQFYYQTEPHRFHLLPPGIAKERILQVDGNKARAKLRQDFHASKDQDLLLLMIGSSFKTKGVDRAIHAFAALPNKIQSRTQLIVIGEDQRHTSMMLQLAKKYGIQQQIHFLGGTSNVAPYLYAADLLLHPALHENTGTVIVEALVAGLPVLTVANCGYAFHVKEAQAGLVCPSPFSQTQLNQALETLLRTELSLLRKHALAYSQANDLYSMPEQALAIIEAVGHRRAVIS